MLPDKVTILTDTAERSEDVDLKRAEEAKAKAQEALSHPTEDMDYDAVNAALRRAEVRLDVAGKAGARAGH